MKRATILRWSESVWIAVGQASQSSQAESAHTDNVGNGVSGRVRPDETHHTDRYHRHTGPFCCKISFFPAGSHECWGWIQIRFSARYQRVAHQVVRWRGKWRTEGGASEVRGGVIRSAETLHFNPIYSLPQQKIITTLKPARRGVEEKASLTKTVPLAPEVST